MNYLFGFTIIVQKNRMIQIESCEQALSFVDDVRKNQGDEVGGSNERCPLTSNFDAKEIHEVNQSVLLIAIF